MKPAVLRVFLLLAAGLAVGTTASGHTHASASLAFTLDLRGPPTVGNFVPASAAVGGQVVITGTVFAEATSVTVNGLTAGFILDSDTQITVTVPAGATAGPIAVTTPSGTGTSGANLTINAPPQFTVQPANVTVVAGGSTGFSVAVTGIPVPGLQWQVSTDGGGSWGDLVDGAGYGGATTGNLSLTGVTTGMSGHRYRALAGNVVQSGIASNEATLIVLTVYEGWQAARFTAGELANPALSGPNADPDIDGLPNLVEYALGLEPKTANPGGLPAMSTTATDWVYTYNRPADRPDLTYVVEVSTDLANWSTAGVTHARIATGSTETWQAKYLLGPPNVFFRLKVTRP